MAGQYTVPLGFLAISNPADSTTYYAGLSNTFAASSDTWAEGHYEIPVAGTIVAVSYFLKTASVSATSEDSTLAIRVDDSSDIAAETFTWDVLAQSRTVTGLSQAVIAGTKIALKFTTPAWVTNPTSVSISAVVYFQ